MNRDELLTYIRECQNKFSQLNYKKKELYLLTNIDIIEPKRLRSTIPIFKTLILTPVYTFIISFIICLIPFLSDFISGIVEKLLTPLIKLILTMNPSYNFDDIGAFLLFAIPEIIAIVYIIYDRYSVIRENKIKRNKYESDLIERKKEIELNANKAQICRNEIHNLSFEINKLMQKNIIPKAYFYYKILNKFEEYLFNNRADTLKECINLFHNECEQQKVKEMMNSYNNKLNEIQINQDNISNDIADLENQISAVDLSLDEIHNKLNI